MKNENLVYAKNIDCKSPISLVDIGTMLDYSGEYNTGNENGYSKIVRIYRKDMYMCEGDKKIVSKTPRPIYAKLENGKLILLAFDLNGKIIDKSQLKFYNNF
jgi:hypothetical protein